MCNVIAVIDKPSANKNGEIVFPEIKIRKTLLGKSQVKRFAYVPLDQGVYTKAEYDKFVKDHSPATAKVKKPSWNPGDVKPCVWRIVVEYDRANEHDEAWKWLVAGSEKTVSEFSLGEKELSGAKRLHNANITYVGIEPSPIAVSNIKLVDPIKETPSEPRPESPFAECADVYTDKILRDSFSMLRARLIKLAEENLSLKEENAILKNRLARIRDDISSDLETAEALVI